MASRTLLTCLAVAVLFSVVTAFYDDDEDLDMDIFEEMQKRNAYEDDDLQMDRRTYQGLRGRGASRGRKTKNCRHWFSGAICQCDDRYGKFDDERYDCMSPNRGYNRKPFGYNRKLFG